jgi:hypothetical protein
MENKRKDAEAQRFVNAEINIITFRAFAPLPAQQ